MSFLDKVKNMVNVSEEEYYDDLDSGDYSSKDRDDDTMFPHRVHHVLFQETEIETEMIPIKL